MLLRTSRKTSGAGRLKDEFRDSLLLSLFLMVPIVPTGTDVVVLPCPDWNSGLYSLEAVGNQHVTRPVTKTGHEARAPIPDLSARW